MLRKYMVQPGDNCGQRDHWTKAKQDYPRMGTVLDKDELPKTAVMGNEDAPGLKCNVEYFRINQTGRIVMGDSTDIVPHFLQERTNARISAFVQQEPHAVALAARTTLRLFLR